jgi:hypothetical protein
VRTEFGADRVRERRAPDHIGETRRRARAHRADVRQLAALGNLCAHRQCHDAAHEFEPLLPSFWRLGAVDQQRRVGRYTLQHIGGRHRHQRFVGHDHQIGMGDSAALLDRRACGTYVGKHRRTAALGAVHWRILHLEAFAEEGAAEDAAGGLDALTAATVERMRYIKSPSPFCKGGRP